MPSIAALSATAGAPGRSDRHSRRDSPAPTGAMASPCTCRPGHLPDLLLLELPGVLRVQHDQRRPHLAGHLLGAEHHVEEERVGEVAHDQPEDVGTPTAQCLRLRVRAVPEALGHLQDARPRLRRDAGLPVEREARGRDRHPRGARDVADAHRSLPTGASSGHGLLVQDERREGVPSKAPRARRHRMAGSRMGGCPPTTSRTSRSVPTRTGAGPSSRPVRRGGTRSRWASGG